MADDLRDKIEAALRSYHVSCFRDDEGNGLPLVDVLSDGGTIKVGLEELNGLADHIASECFPLPPKDSAK